MLLIYSMSFKRLFLITFFILFLLMLCILVVYDWVLMLAIAHRKIKNYFSKEEERYVNEGCINGVLMYEKQGNKTLTAMTKIIGRFF